VIGGVDGDLQVVIPLFDREDHPFVPTGFPKSSARSGGQGWRNATAERRGTRP
jgi:hypothetical protein